MIGESRSVPYRGAMSAAEIERELARLRMNEDGTLGARASVLNLIVVTNEEYAAGVTRVVSELSESYPSRVVLLISDPDEKEPNLEVGLSAFCGLRRGMPGRGQVCAEQIKIHVEGPPARHLESLAGSLLIPDLPVFLWYPNGEVPRSPECDGMASLADRLILDSGAADDCEASLRAVASLAVGESVPAVGDLQWAALSPWRSLVADLFAPPERARELTKIRRVEILHHRTGGCQALLFAGWLSTALGWRPESTQRAEEGRVFCFAGPSGDVIVELAPSASESVLSRIRIYSEGLTLQLQTSRKGKHTDARSTVTTREDEPIGERIVHLGSFDPSVLLGEELKLLGRDETYESALERAAEMLGS
jgi:glucose-6-phosphate dehydrogenase assembly protein OpcA